MQSSPLWSLSSSTHVIYILAPTDNKGDLAEVENRTGILGNHQRNERMGGILQRLYGETGDTKVAELACDKYTCSCDHQVPTVDSFFALQKVGQLHMLQ